MFLFQSPVSALRGELSMPPTVGGDRPVVPLTLSIPGYSGLVHVGVYNMLGKEVMGSDIASYPNPHALSFDFSGLPDGLYVVMAKVGHQSVAAARFVRDNSARTSSKRDERHFTPKTSQPTIAKFVTDSFNPLKITLFSDANGLTSLRLLNALSKPVFTQTLPAELPSSGYPLDLSKIRVAGQPLPDGLYLLELSNPGVPDMRAVHKVVISH